MSLAAISLPIALCLFIGVLVVLPLARLRLSSGQWGLVVRNNDPGVETFVRWWTVLLLLAVAVWSLLVATQPADSLAIWTLPRWVGQAGVGLLVAGFVLVALAQAQMGASWRIGIDDEPTDLVTHGLYRWVRHPIYTGILAMFVGIVCLTPSPWTISGLCFGVVMIGLQSRLEDEHVKAQHPSEFRAWASRVGRLVPLAGRIRGGAS